MDRRPATRWCCGWAPICCDSGPSSPPPSRSPRSRSRGWESAQKKPFVANAPAATTSAELPTVKPADLAAKFGNPMYVATDVAVPDAGRGRRGAAKSLAARSPAPSPNSTESPAAIRNPRRHGGHGDNVGPPFDGKYTITSSHGTASMPTAGYITAIAVTGRQERTPVRPHVRLRQRPGGDQLRGGRRPVSDVNDPQGRARVKLTYPWLSDDYVSDWARTVQPGAGKDRGAMVRAGGR